MSSAPRAPKMANAWLCPMRPNTAPFWNNLGFERQLQPCSISETCENFAPTYQCWLHSGHHQLGRVHLGVGAYGSQIGVHMCGERPAAVIPTHAAGNNFWALRSLSSSSTVINWPVRELFPSCQDLLCINQVFRGELDKCRDDANNFYELMIWLGTRLAQAILPGQFFLETGQKNPWSGPPLTMQQDDKHCVFARRFLR